MSKTLLLNLGNHKKYHYLVLCVSLFFIQKTAATTFYINDTSNKGDIYTTAIGSESNNGTSAAHPMLSITAAYQKAQDGDTIIIDKGTYTDLSEKGELLFAVTKRITFVIAGAPDAIRKKTVPAKKMNAATESFYIVNDQPVDRETYLKKSKNTTKPQ